MEEENDDCRYKESKKRIDLSFRFRNHMSLLIVPALYQDASAAKAKQAKQTMFRSPEEAVKAFADAIKADDLRELLTIFGPGAKEIIFSGDEVADKTGRDRFAKSYEEMNKLVREDDKKVVLHVGSDDWPFPIPIVKKGETGSSIRRRANMRSFTAGSAETSSTPSRSAWPTWMHSGNMRAPTGTETGYWNTPRTICEQKGKEGWSLLGGKRGARRRAPWAPSLPGPSRRELAEASPASNRSLIMDTILRS